MVPIISRAPNGGQTTRTKARQISQAQFPNTIAFQATATFRIPATKPVNRAFDLFATITAAKPCCATSKDIFGKPSDCREASEFFSGDIFQLTNMGRFPQPTATARSAPRTQVANRYIFSCATVTLANAGAVMTVFLARHNSQNPQTAKSLSDGNLYGYRHRAES